MALQSRSPQRPDDLVVEVEPADAVAVDRAVGVARKASATEKGSSYGPREQGKAARDLSTSTRTITINPLEG